MERKPIVNESDEACYMVPGNDFLEVTLKSYLDDCASSFNDHDSSMDSHALNKELFMFCENLLLKYKTLKKKSFELKKENEMLFSNLDLVLKEKLRFQMKGIH